MAHSLPHQRLEKLFERVDHALAPVAHVRILLVAILLLFVVVLVSNSDLVLPLS